jgi:hypothetical protein
MESDNCALSSLFVYLLQIISLFGRMGFILVKNFRFVSTTACTFGVGISFN